MNDHPQPEEQLTEELRALGKNLVEVLRAAWESPERKQLQNEIETGLNELGGALRREAEYFASSPTGQQLKSEVHEIGERIRSGDAQEKARQELLGVLNAANSELEKIIRQWSAAGDNPPQEPPQSGEETNA